MRAFLCSYFAGVEPAFKNFLRGNPSQQQVVFIPTASTVENTTFYVQDALNVFKNLGLTPIFSTLQKLIQKPRSCASNKLKFSIFRAAIRSICCSSSNPKTSSISLSKRCATA